VWLARAAPGRSVDAVAAELLRAPASRAFTVSTITDLVRKQQRTLTALNLGGLGRIEAVAGVVVAAMGVGLLGAFMVLERRREFALLRSVGADTRAVLTGPLLEGALTTVGSLVVGLPLGVLLCVLSVRVLGLFFNLPPPVVSVPVVPLAILAIAVVTLSAVAFGAALRRISGLDVAPLLREQ
jgi:ABC-type antimicrobial peptide transport system permease subunit